HQAYGELLAEDALMIIDPPWVIDEQSGQFSTSVRLPANAPPGRYQVIAFTRGVGQTLTLSSGFELIQSGIVSRLATTAYQQPALYGIAALLFALLFGWLIGIIFNRR
ncbi:MAG: TIGR02186 family protein, partial [Gammaproteobacteria bacterium]